MRQSLFSDGELVDDPAPGAVGLFAGDFGVESRQ